MHGQTLSNILQVGLAIMARLLARIPTFSMHPYG